MNDSTIITNPVELISGTSNTLSSIYIETAKSIQSNNTKGLDYMKDMAVSITKIASQKDARDKRLMSSAGNVKNFSGYNDIQTCMNFLAANNSTEPVKYIKTIYSALEEYQPQYTEGYRKQVELVIYEYELSLYLLVTGLSYLMASMSDVKLNSSGIKLSVKNSSMKKGVIIKLAEGLSKELKKKEHLEYLNELLKVKETAPSEVKEAVIMEEVSVLGALQILYSLGEGLGKLGSFAINTFKILKRTMFGIIPFIRSILYLRYKRKADTILALEEQANFIRLNINQLNNMKTMDEVKKKEIIKQQEAFIDRYLKKAEKLRAELAVTESETILAIKEEEKPQETDSEYFEID